MSKYTPLHFITVLALTPFFLFAQTANTQPVVELSNTFPQPQERIQATVRNTSSSAPGNLTWRIDNQVNAAHTNQRTIQFTAGALGTTIPIQVFQGERMIAEATVRPTYVDIIVEPQTYVPSFYEGRPLPSAGSQVRLTALVDDGRGTDFSQYTYTWRFDNQLIAGGAARGASQITTSVPNRRSVIVSVEVSRVGVGVVARNSITVPIVEPQTIFYSVSALHGLQPQALTNNTRMSGNVKTIRALPFYFPLQSLNQNAAITWRVNGQERAANTDTPFELTLRRDNTPQANVRFTLQNRGDIIYNTSSAIDILY